MANLTALNDIVVELFSVINTLITEFVNLLTGNLIVLIFVVAIIGLFTSLVFLIIKLIKDQFDKSTKLK